MKISQNYFHLGFLLAVVLIASCKKYEAPSMDMTPIDLGATTSYESLPEDSMLTIPVKYTSTCDSGILKAVYKVVNNRANDITLVQSPELPLSFSGKVIDTTIKVPIQRGLISVVFIINDKCGHISRNSVNVKSITPSTLPVKTLTDVVMSTDPADNTNFFSFYEPTPVFGRA